MPTKPPTHRSGPPRRPKTADPFYKRGAWLALRRLVLLRDPMCVQCLKENRLTESRHVDHVISRATRPDLEMDADNLQGLCASCHSVKTRKEMLR